MLITEKFERVFYRLCAIALGLSIFYFILFWSNVTPSYGLKTMSPLHLFLNIGYYMAIPICLWWGVAQLTDERLGSSIAGSIQALLAGYLYYRSFTRGNSGYEHSFSAYWMSSMGLLIAVSVFAYFYFKEKRKLAAFVLIAFLVLLGFNMPTYDYGSFVEKFYRLFGAKDLLSLDLPIDSGRSRQMNMFAVLLANLQLPSFLITIWFLTNKIKNAKIFNFQQIEITEAPPMSALTFSLIHWVTRLTLFTLVFGAMRQLEKIGNLDFALGTFVLLTAILVALYVVSVIYRNFLVVYFISRAKYPSWCYLLLNIPFVHTVAWISAVVMPPSKAVDHGNQQMVKQDFSDTFRALKLQFAQHKNAGIMTFMLIIIILYVVGNALSIRSNAGAQSTTFIIMGIVSILLLLWYKSDKRAVYFIFLFEAVCLYIITLLGKVSLITPILFLGLSNYIIYYALFHFDQFILVSEEEETTPMAISSSS